MFRPIRGWTCHPGQHVEKRGPYAACTNRTVQVQIRKLHELRHIPLKWGRCIHCLKKTAMSILLGQPARPANASLLMRQRLYIQNEGLQGLQALVDELHGGQNFCQDVRLAIQWFGVYAACRLRLGPPVNRHLCHGMTRHLCRVAFPHLGHVRRPIVSGEDEVWITSPCHTGTCAKQVCGILLHATFARVGAAGCDICAVASGFSVQGPPQGEPRENPFCEESGWQCASVMCILAGPRASQSIRVMPAPPAFVWQSSGA